MNKIYAFDFDGTLTRRDTLLEFIRYSCGNKAFCKGFLRYSPLLVLMKLGQYPNWKVKQKVFAYFFKGMPLKDFDQQGRLFALDNQHLLRPKGVDMVKKAQAEDAPWGEGGGHSGGSEGWSSDGTFPHQELLRTGEGEPHPRPLSPS